MVNDDQLERMLRRVLVPVEPSPAFLRRLHGRLVELRGGAGLNGWMLVVAAVTMMLIGAAWMGLALRIALAILGVFGLIKPGVDSRRAGVHAAR